MALLFVNPAPVVGQYTNILEIVKEYRSIPIRMLARMVDLNLDDLGPRLRSLFEDGLIEYDSEVVTLVSKPVVVPPQ